MVRTNIRNKNPRNTKMNKNNWSYNEQAINLGEIPMDLYHLTQASTIFNENQYWRQAVHDYFIRKTPFGSYVLVAGTEMVLKNLYNLHFSNEELDAIEIVLKHIGSKVQDDFLEYLRKFSARKFMGTVAGRLEGSIALPQEPIFRITGEWLETWIIETMILKYMNYASFTATYASRAVTAAKGIPIAGFGLRRGPGDGNAITAERSGYIGGFASTSNVLAGIRLGIPISGTMSHELVQGFALLTGSETEGFVIYGRNNPGNQIFLTDTFVSSRGMKHAIEASEILGQTAKAIREDSGDLVEKAFEARRLDNDAKGFEGVALSGDLNIWQIHRIANSGADVTFLGLGTNFISPAEVPDTNTDSGRGGYITSALGGVYKLSALENNNGELEPTLKLSSDESKTTLPGIKEVWHEYGEDGKLVGSKIMLADEEKPEGDYDKVLIDMMKSGKMLYDVRKLSAIREFSLQHVAKLKDEHRRIKNPEPIPVVISDKLLRLRKALIEKAKNVK
jgi:nicotinate phosphoribosyltransferase